MTRPLHHYAIFLLATVFFCFQAAAQEYEGVNLVKAQLVAEKSSVSPGSTVKVGLLLDQAEGWHTYWQYAGDSGLATSIDWTVPDGITAGPIQWPVPKRIVEPGNLIVFAYKDQVMLISELSIPDDYDQKEITVKARADWLVCREICIPGSAELELKLPVATKAEPADKLSSGLFDRYSQMLPDAQGDPPFGAAVSVDSGTSKLTLTGWQPDGEISFAPLPADDQIIGHAEIQKNDGDIEISIPITGGPQRPITGVVVEILADGRRGWSVAAEDQATAAGTGESPAATGQQSAATSTIPATPSLLTFLFYGFIGGLILNLMPCVLPVISLKIFGFMKQADEKRGRIFRLGLAFCAGIFVWFLGLAVVIIALRSGGEQVNWAFQFQNPVFLLVICGLLVVFALNLFGVFEITLPGSASQQLSGVTQREGYSGVFLHGIFATILATPCTAPFLGTALGFAFSQPPAVILAMFTAIATGMALPFFLLSANPGWMKFLPKPGRWMESLKQFMGFPLLATLIWLLWVLGNQGGMALVTRSLCWLLALGLACWAIGRFATPQRARAMQLTAWSCAVIITIGGWLFFLPGQALAAKASQAAATDNSIDGIAWQKFSREKIKAELAAGRPVFIDFTAEWCITCKFNERSVIDTPEVRELIDELDIAMLKGDWTNSDPEIGDFLAEHGRVGVPFYLVYSPANPTKPEPLPELLTKPILIDALKKASAG